MALPPQFKKPFKPLPQIVRSLGPAGVRVSRIIYIEGDDGTITIDKIPGMTQQDIFQAAVIITDTGRILKNRTGHSNTTLPSFDLVKDAPPKKPRVSKTKSKYRSIFDPTETTCDQ
jgi:hypothetical protein